jgi:hypothetical protein
LCRITLYLSSVADYCGWRHLMCLRSIWVAKLLDREKVGVLRDKFDLKPFDNGRKTNQMV